VFWQVEPFMNLFLEMLNLSSQQHKNVEFKIGVWEFWWPPNSNSFHQKRFNTSTINQVFVFYQLIPNTFISQRIAIPRLGTPPKLYSPLQTPLKSSILINYMELCMMTIHSIRGNNVDYSTPLFLRVPSLPAVRVLTFIQSTVGSIMRLHHSL